MCLAVPGKVLKIYEENGLRMGRIDYAGAENAACLSCVPEAAVGRYVIVHAGFALQVLDEDEAAATLRTLTELNALIDEDDDAGPAGDRP
ncbi:HypC/HybG/HupF family hydrogenase formation chaperone [bacterium]|nr:HypC/HybG/HupF family hydrogenase formation chaperone [bacterium]MBU1676473.1 HypC/HybG/HupF family hydrogenase formation chaperone [bacterium]